jgi:membrane fusion protein, multidrug efflux system
MTGATAQRRARRPLWLVVAAAAIVLAAGAAWWRYVHVAPGGASAAAAVGPPGKGGNGDVNGARAQPVSVAEAQQRDVPVSITAIGSIASANTAVVRAKVDGELKEIYFTEGQTVRAGQLLAQIDRQPFQIALNIAKGALERDKAQLRNAQLDLRRYRDLIAKDAAPKQQLDTQQALVEQLRGTMQADQAAVDNAVLQLSYTRVVAPIAGLAGLKQADLGNIIHASDANGLLTIAQMQPAAVVFAVPEAQLSRIRQGLKGSASLPVEAWDRDGKTLLAQGVVASTDNTIDSATGTIRVKALFPNADNSLFANQFVNVRLQLDVVAGALAVPSASVQRGAQGTYVYVVADDSTVSLRPVTVSSADGDWVAVQGKLKPGERVVTDGTDRLREGAKAEVAMTSPLGRGNRSNDGGANTKAETASTAAGASAAQIERLRWIDGAPPEMIEKLKAMSDAERRDWFRKRHEAGAASSNGSN